MLVNIYELAKLQKDFPLVFCSDDGRRRHRFAVIHDDRNLGHETGVQGHWNWVMWVASVGLPISVL